MWCFTQGDGALALSSLVVRHGNPQVLVVVDGDLVALALTIVWPWSEGPIASAAPVFFFKMQALMPLITPPIACEGEELFFGSNTPCPWTL